MQFLGYLAAMLIGVSLGLIGGGGSILTVPVMVYLFHVNPTLATSYSLFTVGITSLTGAFSNYKKGALHLPTAFLFGSSSIVTVLLIRRFIVPAIPEILINNPYFLLTKETTIMLLFAVLMILASFSMIRSSRNNSNDTNRNLAYGKLVIYGLLIGIVTGLLGAGGGFLLIPALVLLVRLPMRTAIGTSLLIIAMNSLIGFLGDVGIYPIDWKLLGLVSILAIAGILIGTALGRRIDGSKLKKGFGWFVLVMGVGIILRELFKH